MSEKNVIIIELGEIKLVGYRVLCPGDEFLIEIPKASINLHNRINEVKQKVDPSIQWGAFIVDESAPEEDGYWVGVEVEEYEEIPSGMVPLTIPPHRYAVIRHEGPNHLIRESYEELHNWVEKSGYIRLKEKWHLEKYYNWKDTQNIEVELLDTIE